MKFKLLQTDEKSNARLGKMETAHGIIETPVFMPVGTLGTVKGVSFEYLKEPINASVILGNTYHLYLRPGLDTIHKAGGLHKFINWDRPLLTDSGGYQVYSLSDIRKLTDKGVAFQSHIDGSKHLFTPENVVDTQRIIGADIIMALDECTPYPCEYEYAKNSLKFTHDWLERGVKQFKKTEGLYGYDQSFFPIVQGSVYKDLRKASAEFIANQEMEGNAIGGLSVGEPHEDLYEMTDLVCSILPSSKPRYLMGVGTPANLLECIALGIDMFDCVMPTRNARNGMLFTSEGFINIKNKKWEQDFSPIDMNSTSFLSQQHSKAYLRHLVHNNEMLGAIIASTHNLAFYTWLMKEARQKIKTGSFRTWKDTMVKKLITRL